MCLLMTNHSIHMYCRVTKWSVYARWRPASPNSGVRDVTDVLLAVLQLNATLKPNCSALGLHFRSYQPIDHRWSTQLSVGVVRDFGVLLDSELTMKPHINKLVSTCFYHLRRLKRHVNRDVMEQLVSTLILRHLDYCNSVLVGLPWSTIAPLQLVQNATARLVMGLSARDHVGPALRELRWLPVVHRIKFKEALLMYIHQNRLCPLYVSEVLTPPVVPRFISDYVLLTAAISLYEGREPSSVTEHFRSLDRRSGTRSLSQSG